MPRSDSVPPAYAYGDASSRLVAYFIDAVLLAAIVFAAAAIISAAFGPVVRFRSGDAQVDEGLAVVNALVATALSAVYFILSWRRLGASPGQRLLGMRLGRELDGSRLGLRPAVVRWSLLALPLGIAGLLTALLPGSGDAAADLAALLWYVLLLVTTARSRTKQGLHDRAARSIVVRRVRHAPWSPPVKETDVP